MKNEILNTIGELGNSSSCTSSNPYDYILDSKAFDRLTSYGLEALPVVLNELEESEQDGLKEYLLALAVEKISGRDLRAEGLEWATGKEWLTRYQSTVKSAD